MTKKKKKEDLEEEEEEAEAERKRTPPSSSSTRRGFSVPGFQNCDIVGRALLLRVRFGSHLLAEAFTQFSL
jgi:hypothetical protein